MRWLGLPFDNGLGAQKRLLGFKQTLREAVRIGQAKQTLRHFEVIGAEILGIQSAEPFVSDLSFIVFSMIHEQGREVIERVLKLALAFANFLSFGGCELDLP